MAVGASEKVGWGLSDGSAQAKSQRDEKKPKKSGSKKELTDAQKKALAKLRKS